MYVTCGAYRLAVCIAESHDLFIHGPEIFLIVDIRIMLRCYLEPVVVYGLDLQVIIKIHKSCYYSAVLTSYQGRVYLASLTGTAYDETFPVFCYHALRYLGLRMEIFHIGHTDELV